MSIVISREIHCDGCGEWAPLEFHTVNSFLYEVGWFRFKGLHYCPACKIAMSKKITTNPKNEQTGKPTL